MKQKRRKVYKKYHKHYNSYRLKTKVINGSMYIYLLFILITLSLFDRSLAVSSMTNMNENSTPAIEKSINKINMLKYKIPIAGATQVIYNNDEGSSLYAGVTKELNDITNESIDETEKVPVYNFNKTGYVSTTINVRQKPNTDSNILDRLYFNNKIKYAILNDEWAVIEYEKGIYGYAYISLKYITDKKLNYVEKKAYGDTRKSYMDYRYITSRASKQYRLQQISSTASNGVRICNGRYMIAMPSAFTHKMGQYVDVVLNNGTVIPCIIGDAKSDRDTINNHSLGIDHGVAEFIVDTPALSRAVKQSGDVSDASKGWNSNVNYVRIYDKFVNV